MELQAYLHIVRKHWLLVLLAFATTYASTLVLTFMQVPTYQARATFIVRVEDSSSNDRNLASTLDILSRRPEIANTFTRVADSRLIKTLAADELGLSLDQRNAVNVASRLIPGTNVLEIASNATDPAMARDFTNMVGAKTIDYVQNLYATYSLSPLDQANLPSSPSTPNKPLAIGLGAVAGLVLGIGIAFLSSYLSDPPTDVTNFSIRDGETGVYNKRYFLLRLRQELSRAKRNSYPLSIGLLNLNPHGELDDASPTLRQEVLRRVSLLLKPYLRDEDVIARYSDTVFALLLPDIDREMTRERIDKFQRIIATSPVEIARDGMQLNIEASAGAASYTAMDDKHDIGPDDLLAMAMRALQQAEISAYGRVHLLPDQLHPLPPSDISANGHKVPFGSESKR